MSSSDGRTAPHAALLARASLAYLASPVFLFLGFWLRTPLNLVALAALVFVLARAFGALPVDGEAVRIWIRANRRILGTAILYLAFLMAYCGIGGLGVQRGDWIKHNAILQALSVGPWPTWVSLEDGSRPLVYYLAFYLIPGIAGRLTQSWLWVNVALLAWALVGVVLSFLWFAFIAGRLNGRVLAAFFFVAGADVLGHTARELFDIPLGLFNFWPPAWTNWAENLQFSSFSTLLIWVPQHALGGWLAGGVAWYLHQRSDLARWGGLLVFLSAAWSPFVAVGIALICLAHSLVGGEWRYLRTENLVAAPLGLVLALYFASMEQSDQVVFGWYFFLPGGRVSSPTYYASWWLAVNFFDLWLFVLILRRWSRVGTQDRTALTLLAAGVTLLSTVVVGTFNDVAMRTPISVFFIVCSLWAGMVTDVQVKSRAWWLAIFVFLTALATPIQEIMQNFPSEDHEISAARTMEEVETFEEGSADDPLLRIYYFGDPNAAFFRYLAPPGPRPP